MTWWLKHNFDPKLEKLKTRMGALKIIRNFFDKQEFCEAETPILQTMPTADIHIHGFATELLGVDLKHKKNLYLQTSPEFEMKKLIVAGIPNLYQICKTFRNAERTHLHNPEFTMIEWYRTHADYTHIMQDCESLVKTLCTQLGIQALQHKSYQCNPFAEWKKLSVKQAFQDYANINLETHIDNTESFSQAITKQGIRVAKDDAWDDLFFRVMAEKIEPHLGMEAPTILYDYPASMACLARKKESNPNFAERFELYICGIELANAFSELTDAKEQRQRFMDDMAQKKALYGVDYPLDENFLHALEHGMPECAGIALGVDRLIMLLTGAENIEEVLWTTRT